MLTFTIGKTTVYLWPLITFLIVIAVILIVRCVLGVIEIKRIYKSFTHGDYDYVIAKAPKVLNSYSGRGKTNDHIESLERLNFYLAISHFAASNDEKFLEHIGNIKKYIDIKNFWLALFYLQKNDIETATKYYDNIKCAEEMKVHITFLDGLMLNVQGEFEVAKEKMQEAYPKLENLVLIQIADNIINFIN